MGLVQVLGSQRREHEVDLSGPHLGRHCGKNPMAESPNPFSERGWTETQGCSLAVPEVVPAALPARGDAEGCRDTGPSAP